MPSEAQGTLLDLKYGDPAAAEMSELKTDLADLTHKHNRISRVMKMSLFANIVFGLICVVLLSLFLFEIKDDSPPGMTVSGEEDGNGRNSVNNTAVDPESALSTTSDLGWLDSIKIVDCSLCKCIGCQ